MLYETLQHQKIKTLKNHLLMLGKLFLAYWDRDYLSALGVQISVELLCSDAPVRW